MVRRLGLDVERVDAGFDRGSVCHKTRARDQTYIDGRDGAHEQRARVEALRTRLVEALNRVQLVALRGTLGNQPATAHWWRWDPPRQRLILLNPLNRWGPARSAPYQSAQRRSPSGSRFDRCRTMLSFLTIVKAEPA